MSVPSLNDDWVKCQSPRELQSDILTWTTSISRSRVSTVDGLGFSENIDVESMNSLESLLHTVQQLKLKRFQVEDLEEIRFVAAGETFSVSECKYDGTLVAIKRIRLSDEGKKFERTYFQRRLQSVLREILIMCHAPLTHHPNIIDLLGYGWSVEKQRPSPFISVAFATKGTLREYMKEKAHPIRTKLILMGDVGAGLMALHKCGIVHGDLKLDNILVFASLDRPCMSIAKVSDFGHSIIVGSASEKRTQYFGTTLYNAPEVAEQKDQPISIEQLHKCDIWAFGLCAWEILANGQLYFQRSWRRSSLYERSSSQSTSLRSPVDLEISEELSMDADDQNVFGHFDLSHLKTLAIEYVNNMRIPGIGFEKGFLRPLMDRTLQTDPAKRISDLSRLPIIVSWHKTPGGHSLQSKLATYAISGDVRYSIFSRETGPYIIWEQQQQLLQDFEAVAQGSKPDKDNNSMAFQTMLCYINAFGTSQDLTKAAMFLRLAEDAGHLVARILGPRILAGFIEDLSVEVRPYKECLALGFSLTQKAETITSLFAYDGSSITKFTNYPDFRKAFFDQCTSDQGGVLQAFVTMNESTLQRSLLEVPIQQGDVEFVERLLTLVNQPDAESTLSPHLVLAASRGHGGIVTSLLKAGASVSASSGPSLFHWLFCLDETTLNDIQPLLKDQSRNSDFSWALDHAITGGIVLHPQWPFSVLGTPLAVAIASGSLAVIKFLLDLGADPLAFATADENDLTTPIHLAVKYHSPEVFQLLWKAAFPSDTPVHDVWPLWGVAHETIDATNTQLPGVTAHTLGHFPIACSLSLLTNAERVAIHGRDYRQRLRETIQSLSLELLLQTSREGRNSITQAIDLEDVDTIELLLEKSPDLARRKLAQPDDPNIFTYPFHFAMQIGSCRDTKESEQIAAAILDLDPAAVDRFDSASIKPLHIAAMGTSDRMTRFLLDRNATCRALDRRRRTALHFCRAPANAKVLLRSGLDLNLNHKDDFGFAPVHAAASMGADEVLKVLVDAGADLTFANNEIGTPLHCAVQRKSRTTIEILLAAGVDVRAKNRRGQTPLHLAMDIGRSDLVSLLFENGADPFVEDKQGSSPFSMSLAWENPSIFNMFKLPDDFVIQESHVKALIFAAAKGETAAFRQYLDRLPDPSRNLDCVPLPQLYVTAINVAAGACRVDLVEILLSHGFNVDTCDEKGNTPLLRACQAGRTEVGFHSYHRTHMCEKLIQHGANILACNHRNLSPLLLAQAHADYPLMTLLLEHALSRNHVDVSTRRSRILESIKNPGKDNVLRLESRAFIGGEIVDPLLLADAARKEEWEFVMTCIAGHFVVKNDLIDIFPNRTWPQPSMDTLDMLRYYSVKMDREMVQYLAAGAPENTPKYEMIARNVGRRNVEIELEDSRWDLDELVWPTEIKKARNEAMVKSQSDYYHPHNALRTLQQEEDVLCSKVQDYFAQISFKSKDPDKNPNDMTWFKQFERELASLNQDHFTNRLQTLLKHTRAMEESAETSDTAMLWTKLRERARKVQTSRFMLDAALMQAREITKCFYALADNDPELCGVEQDGSNEVHIYEALHDAKSLGTEAYIESSVKKLMEMNMNLLLFRGSIGSRLPELKPPDTGVTD